MCLSGAIKLALTPRLIEAKENASLVVWGLVAYSNKYTPFRGFAEGKVTAILAAMFPELLGFGVVPPDSCSVAVVSMVLLTLLDLGAECPGLQLLAPKSVGKAAPGGQADLLIEQCWVGVLKRNLWHAG